MKLLVKILKSWCFPWLVGGVLLRLVLMPITLHPDLWAPSIGAYFIAYLGEFNIYDYLASLPQTHPLIRTFGIADVFLYPPLTYFTLVLFRLIVQPFSDVTFIPWFIENLDKVHFYPRLYQHLFLFKFPYLFVDVALAFLLGALFDDSVKKKLAFIFWMFNPLALYATFMIGQVDLLPTFFTVLALYFVKKTKPELALISLGIGGSYKMFPLLFIPCAAFVLGKSFKEKIKFLILGFLPFFVFIAPFLSSKAFRAMVLFAPKSQKMLFMGWPVSGAEVIFPFILLLTFIYFYAYYSKKKIPLIVYFIAILLLTFSVTHYHPQWFIWITPFLIWELVENNFKHLLLTLTLFVCWLTLTLLFEASLSYGLFNPLWPILDKAPSLSELVSRYTDVFQLKSLVRSVFAGTSIFIGIKLFLNKKEDNIA